MLLCRMVCRNLLRRILCRQDKTKQTTSPSRATAACSEMKLFSSAEKSNDDEKTQQATEETSKTGASASEEGDSSGTQEPQSPECPPISNTKCPEIARLECLHDPCDTDPEELLIPKEEVQKRRCFKCSTVEESTWVDLSATAGVPNEQLKSRAVTISKAFKNVMQQGTDNTRDWEVQWDTLERWQNPLIGWASTADPLGNVKLSFATQLDAERWCTRNGWNYQVLPEREPKAIPPKSYADNFSWNRRSRVSTK